MELEIPDGFIQGKFLEFIKRVKYYIATGSGILDDKMKYIYFLGWSTETKLYKLWLE